MQLVRTLGWSVDVLFAWQHKEGVAHAGMTGRLKYAPPASA